ncbi:hypothetical protein [Verrucosispora sioxanthis]|uniref:hypothetical protein n=1 Tax=Verrucosispora sioxanthis TaxID=2499994 RepID=UPI0020A1DAD5|nr:hypothetical protein [Verrucosispora sioxanthis]
MSHTDGSGSVYGTRRTGPPRDPLLVTALGVGLVGVLVGVLFATGVLGGGEPAGTDGGRPRSDHGAAQPDRERTGTQPDDVRTVPHTEPRPGSGRDRRAEGAPWRRFRSLPRPRR